MRRPDGDGAPGNRTTARVSARQYFLRVTGAPSSDGDQVRTAELLAALSLVTDLARRFPLEHGLHSTLVAMRLCDRLGVDESTARDTFYGCLLFYVGCTADAEVAAEFFDEGALGRYVDPVLFGSRPQAIAGLVHALAGTGNTPGPGRPGGPASAAGRHGSPATPTGHLRGGPEAERPHGCRS